MAEDMMDVLGTTHFITMRSFTVELQTYIEQGTTAELHTVTVRNVVDLGFRCDNCEEALKSFDALKAHWKSSICGTDDIGIQAAIPLIQQTPVKTSFSDQTASEMLDINSDNEGEVDHINIEPSDKIKTEKGIKEHTQNSLHSIVDKDSIEFVQENSVESVLLAEHSLLTQTEISQSVDQHADNIIEETVEFKNVGRPNVSRLVYPVTLVRPSESTAGSIEIMNSTNKERPLELISQSDISQIQESCVESTAGTLEIVSSRNNERAKEIISQSDISEIQENCVESSAHLELLRCTVCNQTVPRDELVGHACVGNSKGVMIKCRECDVEFETSADLKKHSKAHAAVTTFPCAECDKVYVHRHSLKLHMHKHTGEKPHKCAVCEKSFSSKNDLSKHETRHRKLKPYQCPECGKGFADKSYLSLHLKRHKDESSYSCDSCGQKFTTRSQLTTHSRKHTGEKPYGCQQCDKTFSSISTLKYHEATHTGLRPFACEICQATFICRTALRAHSRVHTGEKPYKCEICGRSFASNVLKLHMRYHAGEKPFKCDVCGNQFVTKTHLATHMRCHSGEKPYSCDKCDKTFGHKSSLSYHLRSHTGEKPFSCPVCEKRFKDSQSMKRHAITCAINRLGKKKNLASTPPNTSTMTRPDM